MKSQLRSRVPQKPFNIPFCYCTLISFDCLPQASSARGEDVTLHDALSSPNRWTHHKKVMCCSVQPLPRLPRGSHRRHILTRMLGFAPNVSDRPVVIQTQIHVDNCGAIANSRAGQSRGASRSHGRRTRKLPHRMTSAWRICLVLVHFLQKQLSWSWSPRVCVAPSMSLCVFKSPPMVQQRISPSSSHTGRPADANVLLGGCPGERSFWNYRESLIYHRMAGAKWHSLNNYLTLLRWPDIP